jgi:hypothetical protein
LRVGLSVVVSTNFRDRQGARLQALSQDQAGAQNTPSAAVSAWKPVSVQASGATSYDK